MIENDHFILPGYQQQIAKRWLDDVEIQTTLEGIVGLPLNLLHRIYREENETEHHSDQLILVEAAFDGELPHRGGRWLSTEEFTELVELGEKAPLIKRFIAELEGHIIPFLRPPWAIPGWRREALAWIDQELGKMGRKRLGRPEAKRLWELAAVLRLATDLGPLYFKAVADLPYFVNEGVILRELAGLYPQHVPMPLALDEDRQFMILPDLGALVGLDASLEEQMQIVEDYARLQVDCSNRVGYMLTIGCLDRRLDVLEGQVDYLFNNPILEKHLTTAEIDRLKRLAAGIKENCQRLIEYDIPQTLIHGDLHGDNVAFRNGRSVIIDWTDACIAHPFIDLVNIHFHPRVTERSVLRDHYIKEWEYFETPQRLLEAWELAQPLMCLHQSISYQVIVENVEEGSQLAWGLSYWLRALLNFSTELSR